MLKKSNNHNFRLSRNDLDMIKRVFDVFDDDFDGIIESRHLGVAMRALGLFPSEAELSLLLKEIDPQQAGKIEMGDFFVFIARRMKENAEILAATKKSFKVLSNESTGTINIQSLISSLTDDAGEPLSSNEVDFFIQSIPSEAFGKRGEGELKLSELENFLFQTDLESQKTILQSKSKS